jgi:hypothetical protein
MRHPRYLIAAVLVAVVFVTSAESCDGKTSAAKETDVARYSQLRQTLIEIEEAQAKATATTSFMFLAGAGAGSTGPLLASCPSIGFPIPSTYQLTAPEGKLQDHNLTVPQMEANGVYTGDSTGTYVLCVGGDGKPFVFYWEGYVATVTGPAHWDNVKGEIVMDGPSSVPFTKK